MKSREKAAPKSGQSLSANDKAKRTDTKRATRPNRIAVSVNKLDYMLAASAVSEEVAVARGYKLVTSQVEMVKRGFSGSQCRIPSIVIPVHSVRPGEGVVGHQMRPEVPRDPGRKYESPLGSEVRLDVSPAVKMLISDPTAPLFITEGAKKADAAASIGLCCISVQGVDAWSSKKKPLDDWKYVALRKRTVYVAYDSDVMTKPSVGGALERLTEFLQGEGADVRWVMLPNLPGLEKTSLDDFIAAFDDPDDLLAYSRLPEDVIAEPTSIDVAKDLRKLKSRQKANQLHEQIEASRSFVTPPSLLTLADELALPDDELKFPVESLHPEGGNTLLAAQFKAGKTTLLLNLLRAAVDGEPFLGRFATDFPPGRVAFWNYELSERQFRKWLRDHDIKGADRASVWNLRGYRMPLTAQIVEDAAVEWLIKRDVSTLIIDPYARAYGGAENDNPETNLFLEAIDVIKRRAGVPNVFVAAHFGREQFAIGKEHARGATRLDDWADVRWVLTEENGIRYFRANGRDVDVPEASLKYDHDTRRLTLTDSDRKAARKNARLQENLQKLTAAIADSPGINATDLQDECGFNKNLLSEVKRDAQKRGVIRVENGPGGTKLHYVTARKKLKVVPND